MFRAFVLDHDMGLQRGYRRQGLLKRPCGARHFFMVIRECFPDLSELDPKSLAMNRTPGLE